ncbi:MAG TPA: methionine synthase [Ignisphaera aggregans]|uniref:Methionine synthase n=1 Tax=Ignisphaera aggregans TaxID=334771 RepID=A0A832YYL8_9CREN|nr:methionine synthase [Ignisphaera aggregans]
MRTSHVGSFPLPYSLENVERVLRDLAELELDIAPYPQMRSFVEIYIEPLISAGIVEKRGDLYISTLEALDISRVPQPRIPEAEHSINIVKRYGLEFKGLRAPVTGPFTLASRIYVGDPSLGLSATALARPNIVREFFVPYVARFVEYLQSLGYNYVFLDEPILGIVVGKKRVLFGYSENDIVTALDTILSVLNRAEGGIHVCGALSPKLFEILCSVPRARYINIEFHDSRQNLDIVSRELLERYDKILAPGVVSSRNPAIESVDEIRSLINRVREVASDRVDLVSADCGFAGLREALPSCEECYAIAIEKLRRIVKAVRSLDVD